MIRGALEGLRPATSWGRILDVGCGDGLFFDHLSTLGDVEGVEADPALVSPDGRWAGRIHVGPFDRSFAPRAPYGLVLMLDVLEHLDDPAAALDRAAELLVPGGTLVVTVPALRALWTHHDDLNRHRTRYRRTELLRLVSSAGLRIERARYFFCWTVPVKLALRAKEALLGPSGTASDLPGAAVNAVLLRLSRLEEALLRGRSAPLGSSLLVVARKPPAS